jgi:preprotein translocase subunit YajC
MNYGILISGLLAQAEAAPKEPPPPAWMMYAPFIAIAILFYFVILAPQRRDQKKRDQLRNELKKDDRVVTIGGILGTVANVLPERDEVVVKVDDNLKIRFRRSAIAEVLSADRADESKPG